MKNVLRKIRHFFLPLAFLFIASSFTGAYYSDRVAVTNNTFTAGTWVVDEGESEASPLFHSVVINELMWMGSTVNSDDEWIELRNMTTNDISIGGWKITKYTTVDEVMLTIPSGATIPANGYFLISKFGKDDSRSALNMEMLVSNSVGLRNSNLRIKLYKDEINDGNLVDVADDGVGFPLSGYDGGLVGPRKSMSRKSTPGDGTQASNWFIATNNSTDYWDSQDGNHGTPGGANE